MAAPAASDITSGRPTRSIPAVASASAGVDETLLAFLVGMLGIR